MQQNFDNALFCQFNIMGHKKMGVQRSIKKKKCHTNLFLDHCENNAKQGLLHTSNSIRQMRLWHLPL